MLNYTIQSQYSLEFSIFLNIVWIEGAINSFYAKLIYTPMLNLLNIKSTLQYFTQSQNMPSLL